MGVISAVYFRERSRVTLARPQGSTEESQPDRRAQGGAAGTPSAALGSAKPERDEYAATGMGRQTDHAITQVWLDLEETAAQRIDIRYEFRPQLVRLGILPAERSPDPLQHRERANGFEPGFSPEPPHR